MIQKRWKSYQLWIAIISLIAYELKKNFNIDLSNYDFEIETILTVLMILGIISNPEKKKRIK